MNSNELLEQLKGRAILISYRKWRHTRPYWYHQIKMTDQHCARVQDSTLTPLLTTGMLQSIFWSGRIGYVLTEKAQQTV